MFDFLAENRAYLLSAGAVGLVLFVATLVGVPLALASLPEDYFLRPREYQAYRPWDWIRTIGRNILGWLLLFTGIWMLVAPGQGILTILVGLMLIDFPGKLQFERWLLQRPGLKSTVGWIRRSAGKNPLQFQDADESET